MVEKKEAVIKLLNENYGSVQNNENKVAKLNTKLAKDFSSNALELSKALKKELKDQQALDKEIKIKYGKLLKEINEKHLTLLKTIETKRQQVEVNYQKELKNSLEKHDNNILVIKEQIADLKVANEKLVKEIASQYEIAKKASKKAQKAIESTSDKALAKLLAELKETQEKYEELVVSLNEKGAAQAEKLTAASNKKIKKINEEIEKEQLKVDKALANLIPPFEEKLAEFDQQLLNEKEQYLEKEKAIKSALSSRIARHEKFLNKAVAQGDNRSVKEHRKNIAGLEKSTDKELRLLGKEHSEKVSAINNNKNEFVIANKKNITRIKTEFVKFKEEKLYQIELCKVTLENDLQLAVNSTKLQIETELLKYNEYFSKNEQQQAEVVKQKELDFEKEEDILVTLKIKFDHTNKLNEVKHAESLAIKTSEIAAAKHLLETENALAKNALEIEQAKLESEEKIAIKELDQTIKINEKNERIEHHKIDYLKQGSVNKEYLAYQIEFSKVIEKRTNAVQDHEELEVNNRFNLKLAFLEEQRKLALKDFEVISAKINQVFKVEEAIFKTEIEKIAKEDLEQLAQYEKTSSEEIAAITEKRNALDAKAYKKEIRVLDKEIADKKDDQLDELEKRNAAITKKTSIFDKGLEEAKVRKFTALNEATSIINTQQAFFDDTVELLNKERTNELADLNKRHETSLEVATNFTASAIERDNHALTENTSYQDSRIENDEQIIKEVKALFEQEKHMITTELEQTLTNKESERSSITKNENDYLLSSAKELENLNKETENKVNELEGSFVKKSAEQLKFHKDNLAKIDDKYQTQLAKIANELKTKTDNYKTKTNNIEKATNESNKSFDLAKKQVLKIYNMSLEKELALVNQKFQQDLKNI